MKFKHKIELILWLSFLFVSTGVIIWLMESKFLINKYGPNSLHIIIIIIGFLVAIPLINIYSILKVEKARKRIEKIKRLK